MRASSSGSAKEGTTAAPAAAPPPASPSAVNTCCICLDEIRRSPPPASHPFPPLPQCTMRTLQVPRTLVRGARGVGAPAERAAKLAGAIDMHPKVHRLVPLVPLRARLGRARHPGTPKAAAARQPARAQPGRGVHAAEASGGGTQGRCREHGRRRRRRKIGRRRRWRWGRRGGAPGLPDGWRRECRRRLYPPWRPRRAPSAPPIAHLGRRRRRWRQVGALALNISALVDEFSALPMLSSQPGGLTIDC